MNQRAGSYVKAVKEFVMRVVDHPDYKALYKSLKARHDALEVECESLREKVINLSHMVLSGNVGNVIVPDGDLMLEVPERVAKWMVEFGLPWQVFKCDTHGEWVTELDSSFPYFMQYSTCDKCK